MIYTKENVKGCINMVVLLDYKFTNLNTYINACRTNKFQANKIKQQETEYAKIMFRNVPVYNEPIELTFTWHIKNVCSDLDGKLAKNIIDGLVKAKKIPDDNVKYIRRISHIYAKDIKDYVEVEINKL